MCNIFASESSTNTNWSSPYWLAGKRQEEAGASIGEMMLLPPLTVEERREEKGSAS
jgi:hypothetical protein